MQFLLEDFEEAWQLCVPKGMHPRFCQLQVEALFNDLSFQTQTSLIKSCEKILSFIRKLFSFLSLINMKLLVASDSF